MEKLKTVEETYLVELLNLSSEDIVERFADIIEDDFERLAAEIGSEYPGSDPFEDGTEV